MLCVGLSEHLCAVVGMLVAHLHWQVVVVGAEGWRISYHHISTIDSVAEAAGLGRANTDSKTNLV